MKFSRLCLLIILAITLLPGSALWAQSNNDMFVVGGDPGLLKDIRQFTEMYLDNTSGNWVQTMPDGSTKTFVWGNGKTFVLTLISARFYADTPNTFPYRFLLKAPNGTRMWIDGLTNITVGSTVLGGGVTSAIRPGLPLTVKPTVEVRQLPQPPANPNSGPVISGTVYITLSGYVVP